MAAGGQPKGRGPVASGQPKGRKTSPPCGEEAIHRAVVELLARAARPGVVWTHPANGEVRSRAAAGRLKAMGVVAGWPDLLIVHAGRIHGLELKTAAGRLGPAQRDCHDRLRAAGMDVCVAHGLDAAIAALRGWGVLR